MVLGAIDQVQVPIPQNGHRGQAPSLCVSIHALDDQCLVRKVVTFIGLPGTLVLTR